MFWSSSKKLGAVRFTVLLVVAFVLGASASAGTLYSWKTDDGTFAYTNDKKRIPAQYKGQAASSSLKSMGSYNRLTPGPKVDLAPYAERVVERLEVLRGTAGQGVASGESGVGENGFVRVNVHTGRRSGFAEIEIPVGSQLGSDFEPVVVESVRVKGGKHHNATRHYRVIRQGEKVLAVIKAENNDSDLTPIVREGDFNSTPPLD